MVIGEGFTATELRIVNVLADGLTHRRNELHKLLNDELQSITAIKTHISNIRRKLRPGLLIVCEFPNGRALHYRLVRQLN